MAQDRAAWAAHEEALFAEALAAVREIPGLRLLAEPREQVAVLTFTMDGAHPHDIASILDGEGVCIRAGHHCTQPLHRRFDVGASARASFAPYNDASDVAALVRGLRRVQELFG